MNEQTHEDEISLQEIFQILWSKKILIGIITFVAIVAGFVFAQYSQKTSTVVYTEVYMDWEGLSRAEYPNQTKYNYNDILTEEIVGQTIASNDAFKHLDADELISGKYITVTPQVTDEISGKLSSGEIDAATYRVNEYKLTMTPGKTGLSNDNAELFLENLLIEFTNTVKQNKSLYKYENWLNYLGEGYLDSTDMELDYVDSYSYVSLQYSQLYETAVSYQRKQLDFTNEEGESFTNIVLSLSNYNEKVILLTKQELTLAAYTKPGSIYSDEEKLGNYIDTLQLEVNAMKAELAVLTDTIEKSYGIVSNSLSSRAAALTLQLADITVKKDLLVDLQTSMESEGTKDAPDDFKTDVTNIVAKLNEYTETLNTMVQEFNVYESELYYTMPQKFETEGGISTIIALAGGAFVGFGLGVGVALLLNVINPKKEEEVTE